MRKCDAARRRELDRLVTQEAGGAVGILATRQHQVGHDLRPRVHVDPEQHLKLLPLPLALGDEFSEPGRDAPDLLEMSR